MAENEGGDSKFLVGFLLGFLAGVLICLGAGGAFFMVVVQREAVVTRDIMREAEMARQEAQAAHDHAREQEMKAKKALEQAEEALRKEKEK